MSGRVSPGGVPTTCRCCRVVRTYPAAQLSLRRSWSRVASPRRYPKEALTRSADGEDAPEAVVGLGPVGGTGYRRGPSGGLGGGIESAPAPFASDLARGSRPVGPLAGRPGTGHELARDQLARPSDRLRRCPQ